MTGEPFFWGMPKLADPHWDRLWAVCQDAGMSVNFHIGSGDMSIFERAYEGAGDHANYAGFGVQFGVANVSVIANLITGGVCHRFPDLKFVSVESGVGWLPFALEHLDWQWLNCGVPQEHPEYDLLPSEYFKRQMYGCFWFETDSVKAAIDQMGPGCFLYESDFPHPTSMAPGPASSAVEPREYIAKELGDLPEDDPPGRPPRQRGQALPPRLTRRRGRREHPPTRRPRHAPSECWRSSECRGPGFPTSRTPVSACGLRSPRGGGTMARHRRPDVIEIWVEPLDDVTARRTGERPAPPRPQIAAPVGGTTVGPIGPVAPRMPNPAAHPLKGLSPAFRHLIEVWGDELPGALTAYVDRHLLLEAPCRMGSSWVLRGTLRRTTVSRWIPVELILTPHAERWMLLELVPRRQVRVGQRWFRNGHDSIDRFVADLHRSVRGRDSRPPTLG